MLFVRNDSYCKSSPVTEPVLVFNQILQPFVIFFKAIALLFHFYRKEVIISYYIIISSFMND